MIFRICSWPAAASVVAVGFLTACRGVTDTSSFCWDVCSIKVELPVIPTSTAPVPVAGGLAFKTLSVGHRHVCGLTTAGEAYCWGAIDGSSTFHVAKAPERVPGNVTLASIAAGLDMTCGIAGDGRTFCWGSNGHGQLGNGRVGGVEPIPSPVSGGLGFTQVVVGGSESSFPDRGTINSSFACGLTNRGAAYCWGNNALGQLGNGIASATPQPSPVAVGGDRTFVSLAGNGFATACALAAGGTAYCWGDNMFGELGIGTVGGSSYTPVRVANGLTFVMFQSAGSTCGVTSSAETSCWGSLNFVQDRGQPTVVASIPFTSIATGTAHACGLTADGTAYCWGSNISGELGVDSMTSYGVHPVSTTLRFTMIAAGNDETCALTVTGAAYCWGSDEYAKLGRG